MKSDTLSLPYVTRSAGERQRLLDRRDELGAVIANAGSREEALRAVEELTAVTRQLFRISRQDIHAAFGAWAEALGGLLPLANGDPRVRKGLDRALAMFEADTLSVARFMRSHRVRTTRQLEALGRPVCGEPKSVKSRR
ncbi:hypothetical protein MWN33_18700 [Starkeya koreensis]|uniref:Uncharacterized protein n=1 Tax=Ancylobacter koreensis TaxID=266121 RepID=A0ABT0DS04_9HYPH|nr:hypothetical protein [Ancylobacter koreensis]MCK0210066.1 hypothetical protein [Ancylobacter koreensis]